MSDGRYREIEHTADLGIEVSAPSFAELCETAGGALFALIADPSGIDARDTIGVSATGSGAEELFHAWLCELLAQFNIKGFVAKRCSVERLADGRIEGALSGEPLDLARHNFHTEIKGVTYHDFRVWEENGSWRARIIFDV